MRNLVLMAAFSAVCGFGQYISVPFIPSASSPWSLITIAAGTSTGSTTQVTTAAAIDTTGRNWAVMFVAENGSDATAGTACDFQSPNSSCSTGTSLNTWTCGSWYQTGVSPRIAICTAPLSTVGTGYKATFFCAASCYPSTALLAAKDSSGIPSLDQTANHTTCCSNASAQAGSVTPGYPNELIININDPTTVTSSPPDTFSINGGFTLDVALYSSTTPSNTTLALSHLVETTAVAVNPTLSWSTLINGIYSGNYTFRP